MGIYIHTISLISKCVKYIITCLLLVFVPPCPENNTDYHVFNVKFPVESANVTDTWEECVYQCSKEPSCTHWTWLKHNIESEANRGKCLFKTERGEVQLKDTTISGSKNCTAAIGKYIVLSKYGFGRKNYINNCNKNLQ